MKSKLVGDLGVDLKEEEEEEEEEEERSDNAKSVGKKNHKRLD
jgi:hypothetical protein